MAILHFYLPFANVLAFGFLFTIWNHKDWMNASVKFVFLLFLIAAVLEAYDRLHGVL